MDLDKHDCIDIDECAINNGGCEQICSNTDGGYYCMCQTGYFVDNTNCTGQLTIALTIYLYIFFADIDECNITNGGCEHICYNSVGSYLCSCYSGYSLQLFNGHNCSGFTQGYIYFN